VNKKQRPTIIDVARLAGVSPATAGRVLGGYGSSRTETVERVRRAAQQLGYSSNNLARSMITGNRGMIGVIGADIENPFFARAMRGISDAARERGVQTILTNSDEQVSREKEALTVLQQERVDGVIVSPADLADVKHLAQAVAGGMPVVLLDRSSDAIEADSVVTDNVEAGKRAVGELLRKGYRRVGIVVELTEEHYAQWFGEGADDVDRFEPGALTPSAQRFRGYLIAHREAGVDIVPELIGRVPAASPDLAGELTGGLLRAQPDALFATDGLMAMGAYGALGEVGLRAGENVGFIAFDDLPWTRLVDPQVSTVVQPVYDMGVRAAKLLFDRIEGAALPPRQVVVPSSYVERGSTPPRD
jgi:LacI family transcriptional regulator